jgi:hypothetical protein
MDVLAGFQAKTFARLDEIAQMLGFPGKMGIAGDQVGKYFFSGEIDTIRNYCETDVINTYLIYLRFQLIRGVLSESQYDFEIQLMKDKLKLSGLPHLQTFLEAWEANDVKIS